jgi:uncharacterized protein YpuA (DUF1002 family)
VRKGFRKWQIPFDSIVGGYVAYKKRTRAQSPDVTHFVDIELKVTLPDNKKNWIRNGYANIFNYGFDRWGDEQQKIWDELNRVLEKNDIKDLSTIK